ncbi:hypothetical protein NAI77_09745, partial [Francisella tularensis subsp. holarctica]|uniref:hypothetical protein n=1 Tax=Francisella tularensis TaxID=263 RepID=UPI0023819D59
SNDNMQLCTPTTEAHNYHLLLLQVIRPLMKHLIVMTPKSLLINPMAVSSLQVQSLGKFEEIIDDVIAKAAKVTKRILGNGKV